MKKKEYVAPAMETVEIEVGNSLLLGTSDTIGGGNNSGYPDDDDDD